MTLEQATETLHAFTQATQARGLTRYATATVLAMRAIVLLEDHGDPEERRSFARFLRQWAAMLDADGAEVRRLH